MPEGRIWFLNTFSDVPLKCTAAFEGILERVLWGLCLPVYIPLYYTLPRPQCATSRRILGVALKVCRLSYPVLETPKTLTQTEAAAPS